MEKSLFMQAFSGQNSKVPVWFMRQAGRYLPDYQAIKKRYSLEEMFNTPELASEITCQPIDILNVDAAILFADILTLPVAMGFDIKFDSKQGPIVNNSARLDPKNYHSIDGLNYLEKTIKLVNARLPPHIPLIGFAGSPFTVLTYLIEGGSSVNYHQTFKFMQSQHDEYHALMKLLTDNTIEYLKLQQNAGIKCYQIFDTWGGILRASDYAHYVLPYIQKIFKNIDLPSIYYLKNCSHLLSLMDKSGADFLSVDHTIVLGHHSTIERTKKGIQGNFFNGLLYADYPTIERELNEVLLGAQKHERYIFNLSHGIFPDVEVEKIKFIIEKVHQFPWKKE